ncbi:universal stress protein [Intrasporangium sp. DVR]|uniref:universal stress protein n=1 Tax=Intrasporangium sp. DVR TaxID=3127867 RepID=UPI00313A5C01
MSGHTGSAEAPDSRRIVVGYSGTEGSDPALEWAIEAARREDRPLTILHCYDLAHVPVLGPSPPDRQSELIANAADEVVAAAVERAVVVLGHEAVTGVSVLGGAAGELVAASEAAHLVVTGSHGRGRLLGGLLGSTSYNVTAHARCPAVVVRGEASLHPDAAHRVVVGVDESEAALHALDRAADVAASAGAPLHLVRAIHPSVDLHTQPELGPMVYGETYAIDHARFADELRRYADDATRELAERVRQQQPGVRVSFEVLEDSPGLAIARVGEGAGLIVVGSRGRGGFAGMLLGSVSHTVIHHATSPVMVVR